MASLPFGSSTPSWLPCVFRMWGNCGIDTVCPLLIHTTIRTLTVNALGGQITQVVRTRLPWLKPNPSATNQRTDYSLTPRHIHLSPPTLSAVPHTPTSNAAPATVHWAAKACSGFPFCQCLHQKEFSLGPNSVFPSFGNQPWGHRNTTLHS